MIFTGSFTVKSRGELRNKIETTVRFVRDILLSLKVVARTAIKSLGWRVLETKVDNLKRTNCSLVVYINLKS